MRLWELVVRWLFFSPRTPSRPHHPQLYPIDVDTIARELDLQSEARKLAEAGLPSADQTVISAAEAKALQRVEKARQDYLDWAAFRVTIINDAFARRDVTPIVNRALQAQHAFRAKALQLLTQNEVLVSDLLHRARSQQRELDQFRARNQLQRPALYPEGSATFARYALLLALIVCEGAANAFFFAKGLDSGLVGGFVGAALFAAVNLALAFVFGKFAIPLCFHRKFPVKIAGGLCLTLAIACITGLGLAIAHFRDTLITQASEPAVSAWIALTSAPFVIHDLSSWLLFVVSLLFAACALLDGLASDDRYPGYGRIDRRAAASREEYLDEIESVRAELEKLRDSELDELEGDIRTARATLAELESLICDKESARTRLAAALLDSENCADALLKVFRDANSIARGTMARPVYFDWRPALQALALPDFHIEENRGRLAEQQAVVEHLLSRAETIRAEIQFCYKQHAATLKPRAVCAIQ